MNRPNQVLLEASNLKKYFPVKASLPFKRPEAWVRAVDEVSFQVQAGETLGLVGESGCGKTTTAKMVLMLEKPTGGEIRYQGEDINGLPRSQLKEYRGAVQAVFQDPWSSLSPRMQVGDIVTEPLMVNQKLSRNELRERAQQLLSDVGLDPGAYANYPHEFSGGQRQRIAVARALSLNPRLIVLDEPVSALDVSIQAQIMNMLKDLQERYGVSYLLIAHNLATVRYLSQRVAVMYLGKTVEEGDSEELFTGPLHPYTRALISAAVPPNPGDVKEENVLAGEVPSPSDPPPGCRFHTRCPLAVARCSTTEPELKEIAPGRKVACHLYSSQAAPWGGQRLTVGAEGERRTVESSLPASPTDNLNIARDREPEAPEKAREDPALELDAPVESPGLQRRAGILAWIANGMAIYFESQAKMLGSEIVVTSAHGETGSFSPQSVTIRSASASPEGLLPRVVRRIACVGDSLAGSSITRQRHSKIAAAERGQGSFFPIAVNQSGRSLTALNQVGGDSWCAEVSSNPHL